MAPKAESKAKSAPQGPSYQDMIKDAIINLKERNGSSRVALKKYVKANNSVKADDKMFDALFNRALKSGVEKGVFSQPKGSSGGTKLAKPAAATKPAAPKAKPAAAAAPKKAAPAPKAKAAAPKKAAAAPKKAAAAAPKKTAEPKAKAAPKAKATAPKKATESKTKAPATKKTPKAADAVVETPAVLGKTKSGRVTKTTTKTAPKKAAPKKQVAKKATPKKAAATAA